MLVLTQLGIRGGMIGTIAGLGQAGYTGDGGPATQAALNEPKSLALDPRERLYIADAENHRIRMVDLRSGNIVTVVGDSVPMEDPVPSVASFPSDESSHDPFDEPVQQPKYTQVSDVSGTVRFVVGGSDGKDRFAGDGGRAQKAKLNFPSAVAVDDTGDLYIADTMNHRVRKVDGKTGTITTVAGTGQSRYTGEGPADSVALNEPTALVIYGQSLYIADQSNNRVRRMELGSGRMMTVAGTGEATYSGDGMPATDAALAGPSGLAVGPDGTVYIADTFNGRIRAVDPATGRISTVVGDGREYRYQGPNEVSTSLSRPYGIALDAGGSILITDSDNHVIRRWDRRRGIISVIAGNGVAQFSGDGGPSLASSLNYPFGVATDEAGNIYIADTFNHRVRVIASSAR